MFAHWNDFDRTLDSLGTLLRRYDRPTEDAVGRGGSPMFATTLVESEEGLALHADLPGVAPEAVDIRLHDGVLTVRAERTAAAPEGYAVRRTERAHAAFARSFALPFPVDAERTRATLRDGVLTVRLARSAQGGPRTIEVTAG